MSGNECRCGRPTRDAAYGCDTCADSLSYALNDVPMLDEELEVTTTRQQGIDYRRVGGGSGGKKASERPSPVVWSAADARAHLKALLVSWALLCHEDSITNSSPDEGLPADTLPALSRWLLWRVDGLMLHKIGLEAIDEITDAVAHCRRLIDRPADRQYLGNCDGCEGGRLYAAHGGKVARCSTCDAKIEAEVLRAKLLKQLDDRLCTAAEIARLSTYLGLKADREQVRKRINQWHKRDQIEAHAAFSDDPAFRFGEVYTKLVATEYERKEAS